MASIQSMERSIQKLVMEQASVRARMTKAADAGNPDLAAVRKFIDLKDEIQKLRKTIDDIVGAQRDKLTNAIKALDAKIFKLEGDDRFEAENRQLDLIDKLEELDRLTE